MKEPVLIKGNRYGIVLVMDPQIPFEDLLIQIGMRFDDSAKFFNAANQTAITFEGRELSTVEIERVLDLIKKRTNLRIPYVIDNCKEMEEQFHRVIEEQKVKESQPEEDTRYIYPENSDGMFYKGTLRSGQTLDAKGSIVILGDVNPGATVISDGNIVILGSMRGSAIAGAKGNKNAFVLALEMEPIQIQIGNVIGKSPDKPKGVFKRKNQQTQIAFVEAGYICIEPVSKSVLNDIVL